MVNVEKQKLNAPFHNTKFPTGNLQQLNSTRANMLGKSTHQEITVRVQNGKFMVMG